MASVWRNAMRVGVVLACLSGTVLAAPQPSSAAAGFATVMSGLPDEFVADGEVRTLSAVVSRTDGGGCLKVRWSMVLTVSGLRLNQVKMDRVEENGAFPLDIRTEGSVARLTDRQLDPGTLCANQTVTARYRVAFDESVSEGRITLAAEAYDPDLRLLARQSATRTVIGPGFGATPTVAPTPTESAVEPTESAVVDEPAGAVSEPAAAQVPPAAGRPTSGTPAGGFGVVQAAFLLGGLLLFLGVGLLLRLRQLTRTANAEDADSRPFERPRRWTPARR
ncbi:hypothetical protein [Micromonospora sp. KC723]|uniref:hypothetical protein n=1 Tax=Micromonospora sp. KC723 TaxID=2530381 RepID=UPI001FB765D7|nr:hypothetical protein [Micromonospora sp. KC723]